MCLYLILLSVYALVPHNVHNMPPFVVFDIVFLNRLPRLCGHIQTPYVLASMRCDMRLSPLLYSVHVFNFCRKFDTSVAACLYSLIHSVCPVVNLVRIAENS